jgi:phosphate:Na+ symporter
MVLLGNLLKLSAGIGLFLFAMYLIEESLKNLSGRNFKLFLQKITKSKLGSILGGAIVTGVLQSSSMVSLMVLSFVEAGIITMRNALAVILGANLGTTLASWIVATLGFKFNIDIISYPIIFTGGLLIVLLGSKKNIKYYSFFLIGFGLLFIGLSFMKTSMAAQVASFDFSQYENTSLSLFLIIGFAITLLVQSSSLTMAITLSALYAGAISFPASAAIVLGSETGTTIKLLLSAIGGTASKKRVVLGNFIFNISTTIIIFLFIQSILDFIINLLGISDPLIGLVTFSTLVNLIGIIIFLPFLNQFSNLLERFFKKSDQSLLAYLNNAQDEETITAIDLFKKETEYFIYNSFKYNTEQFEIDSSKFLFNTEFDIINKNRKFLLKDSDEKYEILKQQQGELQAFYMKLRLKLDASQYAVLSQLISSVRSSMHAVKSIKDIRTDINNLRKSSKNYKYDFFIRHKNETEALYIKLNDLINQDSSISFESLKIIYEEILNNYTAALNIFYKTAIDAAIEDIDITMIINLNRELFTANKAMLMAIIDFVLDEKQSEEFNEITVYKT